jgi:hypothetical protein
MRLQVVMSQTAVNFKSTKRSICLRVNCYLFSMSLKIKRRNGSEKHCLRLDWVKQAKDTSGFTSGPLCCYCYILHEGWKSFLLRLSRKFCATIVVTSVLPPCLDKLWVHLWQKENSYGKNPKLKKKFLFFKLRAFIFIFFYLFYFFPHLSL